MDPNRTNLDTYASIANAYHEKTKGLSMRWQMEMFCDMIEPEGHILDLCCGPGRDAREFTHRGYRVTGVDAVPQMIEIARKEAPLADFVVDDARTFDLGEKVDGIWCNAGIFLFDIKDVPPIVERMAAHLPPGGPLYVCFKMGEGGEKMFMDDRYGAERFEHHYDPETFGVLLGSHFDITREMVDYGQHKGYRTVNIMDVFARRK